MSKITVERIITYIVAGTLTICIVASLFTVPTWILWNWLVPKLFGLPKITLLQSLGLLLLTAILFRSSSSKD